MDIDVVPRRRKSVHGVEIDSESVLYDARNGSLHLLNSSASAVWWSIDGTSSVDELAAGLAERFGASHELMRSDLLTLLGVLAEEQLVDAVRSGSAKDSHT
jgi:PqqD family protein of HPr-rel-A system